MAARGSEWISLKRSLIILRRLMLGPASSTELIQAVTDRMGAEAYPSGDRARRAAFKHDRDNLRNALEVSFAYNPRDCLYTLNDPGPYLCIEFSPEKLRTLGIVYQITLQRGEEFGKLRLLFEDLLSRLQPEIKKRLVNASRLVEISPDQYIGPGSVSDRVWVTVYRAIEENRKLTFKYKAPAPNRGELWQVEVAPIRILFRNGHWNLMANELIRRGEKGAVEIDGGYRCYRMSSIQDDASLVRLPNLVSSAHRKPPRYLVNYRLLPDFSDGMVRPYFEDMQITDQDDGSVEIIGYTDDISEAARILLAYGDECIVLGSKELRNAVSQIVLNMAKNYEQNS